MGNYAAFLTDVRKDHDQAEQMYQRALAADPNGAINMGNYANFLTDVRKDHDQAEQMYQRALAADPNRANTVGNYANFLMHVRKDHNQAEQMYQRALTADPNDANTMGNYANFLTDVRKDHDQAEQMYQRALTADPNHAEHLGNYARLLFVLGKDALGEKLALQALKIATAPDQMSLRAECSLYLFMHSSTYRYAAGVQLKALLALHVTTADWSFAANLARLNQNGDSRSMLCAAMASALAIGNDSGLARFPEWQALPSP